MAGDKDDDDGDGDDDDDDDCMPVAPAQESEMAVLVARAVGGNGKL